jgi:hypothetical protein
MMAEDYVSDLTGKEAAIEDHFDIYCRNEITLNDISGKKF